MILTRRNWSTSRNTCSTDTFYTRIPTYCSLKSNTGLGGAKPRASRLSRGMIPVTVPSLFSMSGYSCIKTVLVIRAHVTWLKTRDLWSATIRHRGSNVALTCPRRTSHGSAAFTSHYPPQNKNGLRTALIHFPQTAQIRAKSRDSHVTLAPLRIYRYEYQTSKTSTCTKALT
jgi:hypothetical protein